MRETGSTSAVEAVDPVTEDQQDNYLNHPVSMLHPNQSSIQILPYNYILRISVLVDYVKSEKEEKKKRFSGIYSFK